MAALDDMGLKDRIAGLKSIRDQATTDAKWVQATLDSTENQAVIADMIDTLSDAARSGLRIEGGAIGGIVCTPSPSPSGSPTPSSRHGIEIGTTATAFRRFWRRIGGNRRSQLYTELAHRAG